VGAAAPAADAADGIDMVVACGTETLVVFAYYSQSFPATLIGEGEHRRRVKRQRRGWGMEENNFRSTKHIQPAIGKTLSRACSFQEQCVTNPPREEASAAALSPIVAALLSSSHVSS